MSDHHHKHAQAYTHEHLKNRAHGSDGGAEALEAQNAAHWTEQAKSYEDPASTFLTNAIAGKIREMLGSDLDPTKTALLDYACGPGLVSFQFLKTVKRIVGVDVAQGMVDVFNQRAKDRSYPPERAQAILISKGNLESVTADGNLFDVIVCTHSYHHFHDLDAVTKSLAAALNPGGILVVADFLATGSSTLASGPDGEERARQHGVHHMHGFSPAQLQELFGKHLTDVRTDDTFGVGKQKLKDLGGEAKMGRLLNMDQGDQLKYIIASGRKAE